jgi:uncharacterized protein YjbI with pentapeptide repeats
MRNLEGADLSRAHLDYTQLDGANLEHAHLNGTYLNGASLEHAHLSGAYLNGVNLTDANLEGVDLKGSSLLHAKLGGACLIYAHLNGTDLEKSVGLTQNQVNSALGDKDTHLPRGIVMPESWKPLKAE